MSVIYSFLYLLHMPEQTTAPGMGLSVGAPRELLAFWPNRIRL